LQQRGTIAAELAAAVPAVANWRLSHLPKTLAPAQVERLLACCNRYTPIGRRDYAIFRRSLPACRSAMGDSRVFDWIWSRKKGSKRK
jgi:integrase